MGWNRASNQIKFKTSTIRSNSCDYSDAYMVVSGTITIKVENDNNAENEQMKAIIE